jgi:hypothetical protein
MADKNVFVVARLKPGVLSKIADISYPKVT